MARPATIREEFDPGAGDIRHILDLGLATEAFTKEPKEQTGWYASHLGYCFRRQFLERAGVPPPRGDELPRRQFWLGNIIEYALITRLRHAGLLLADQVHLVSKEHSASGYVDLVYGGHPNDEDPGDLEGYSPAWISYLTTYKDRIRAAFPDGVPVTAVELKTANQYSAEKQFTDGPQFHNIMQGGFYEVVYDEDPEQFPEGVRSIDRFQLVVIAKSDARMLVFPILESHKLKVLGRLDELNDHWPLELPPCTCGQVMAWEKQYCSYKVGDDCCSQDLIQQAPEAFWDLADAALKEKEKEEQANG